MAKDPLQLMLEQDQEVKTKEYSVSINGVDYQKVEADGKSFYFRVLKREKDIPIMLCEAPGGHASEKLIEISLKINRRKRIFFQDLVEKCSTTDPTTNLRTNAKRTWIETDPIIGIHLPEKEDDVIKNKKIGIKNLLKAGPKNIMFMGEF